MSETVTIHIPPALLDADEPYAVDGDHVSANLRADVEAWYQESHLTLIRMVVGSEDGRSILGTVMIGSAADVEAFRTRWMPDV